MKLYHGTALRHMPDILRYGLRPRPVQSTGVWKNLPSKVGMVYLTDSYALFFAMNAATAEVPDLEGLDNADKMVVIEVDADRLHEGDFYPDEDWVGQQIALNPKNKEIGERAKVEAGVLWESIDLRRYQHHWKDSLRQLGTCAYALSVPKAAITRYAIIPLKSPLSFIQIKIGLNLLEHQIHQGTHNQWMEYIFGGPAPENWRVWDAAKDLHAFRVDSEKWRKKYIQVVNVNYSAFPLSPFPSLIDTIMEELTP
jgi:hypothetical protein